MSPLLNQPLRLLVLLSCMSPTLATAQTEPAPAPPTAPAPAAAPAPTPTPAAAAEPAPPTPTEPALQSEAASPAAAQPAPSAAPGKMDLSVPPPPPARFRKAYVHNGFYLRASFGGGGLWLNVIDESDTERYDLEGGTFALSFEALVGGSPADGFVLGGGAFWTGGTSDISDEGVDATASTLLVGPFFDAYPDPKDGFHLGAMAGYALHSIHDHPSGVEQAHGFGGAAWLGYDWWVSTELSAGVAARFNGALTNGDDGSGSLRVNSGGVTLMITAVYH